MEIVSITETKISLASRISWTLEAMKSANILRWVGFSRAQKIEYIKNGWKALWPMQKIK